MKKKELFKKLFRIAKKNTIRSFYQRMMWNLNGSKRQMYLAFEFLDLYESMTKKQIEECVKEELKQLKGNAK